MPSRRWEARNLFDAIIERLLELPDAAVYALIGALAAAENVFPPVPADTAVGIGAFLSQRGTLVATAVFGITWAANVGAATSVYVAGRTLGRQFFTGRLGRRLLREHRLKRIEELYARYGTWGIFVSRFIPGVRAVVPPFAGIARLSAPRSIIPMAVASGIWYGLVTVIVVSAARQIEDVVRVVTRLNSVLVLLVVAAIAAAITAALRRRKIRGSGQ